MTVNKTDGTHTITISKDEAQVIMEALIKFASSLNGRINQSERTPEEIERLKSDKTLTGRLYRTFESELIDATPYKEEFERI